MSKRTNCTILKIAVMTEDGDLSHLHGVIDDEELLLLGNPVFRTKSAPHLI